MNTKINAIKWFGSKVNLFEQINKLIPNHECYIDVFGGAGTILFNKKPTFIEVYNDINLSLYNLFKVLQDVNSYRKLMRKLKFTPFSREIFGEYVNYSLNNIPVNIPDIEHAYSLIIRCEMCFNGIGGSTDKIKKSQFAINKSNKNLSYTFRNRINNYKRVLNRLQNVNIENYDFRKIIKNYDSENTFFYCDPPYYHDMITRSATEKYLHDFIEQDHIDLYNMLSKIKGKFLLSYYDCEFIRNLYKDYDMKIIETNKLSSSNTGLNLKKNNELLIMNYKLDGLLF